MEHQVYNPYLPLNEYIPDGEPHVFDDRVYIYGSHDKENGDKFCMLPYVTYSAPVDDLTDWKYEGVIYTNEGDPHVTESRKYMYAPDVVKGNDGRYYLYYSLEGYGKNYVKDGVISVAVSDSPKGKFTYLGDVRNQDGSPYKHFCMFDPAVFNDNGNIYLYYGAGSLSTLTKVPKFILNFIEKGMHGLTYKEMTHGEYEKSSYLGANVVELCDDMLTVKGEAKRIIPDCLEEKENYPDFVGHGFFEASSIRKFNDKYYFIYSSEKSHDLIYAISDYPDRDFQYQGVLISNGDVGLNGRGEKDMTRDIGNNHGSVEYINGKYYIFYHRHTNQTAFSRQACAEEIQMDAEGRFLMAECTSCGLNQKPLVAKGSYPASIACVIKGTQKTKGVMAAQNGKKADNPYVAADESDQFIKNIGKGSLVGYKYFSFDGKCRINLSLRGNAKGSISFFTDEKCKNKVGSMEIILKESGWQEFQGTLSVEGDQALYIGFDISGKLDLKELQF